MAVVTLTFTGSEEEITSGIPQTVSISSNVPATIYYTIDGTTPTLLSSVYVGDINLPDGQDSVILSAFGVDSEDNAGPILTQTFAADTTRITVSRNVGQEGFVLSRPNDGDNIPVGFDVNGEAAMFLDVDPETLDMVISDRGFEGIAPGARIEVGVPDPTTTPSFKDDNFEPFSTPEIAEFFNPKAKMIVIDTRKDNDLNPVLRPFGSLNNIYDEFNGFRIREAADDATYVSGGFVRRFYDAKNNVMVSYYYDNNEGRYIKNIQKLPANIKPIAIMGNQNKSGQPLVFKWIYRGKQSSI